MKILVIGDAILDRYIWGSIKRQSPEDSSVPVVDFVDEEYRLGGCLNVAANIKAISK
jgi:bifunctional ADP-heptose synthase (sugar kinase/adenylyltransferase)